MKTSSAMRNRGRCPERDDHTTGDRQNRGFVRHRTNTACDFERGKRDASVTTESRPCHARLMAAIVEWMQRLNEYPGWDEWNRQKLKYTLFFDDFDDDDGVRRLGDFELPKDLEEQHTIVIGYVRLSGMVDNIRECEYYFRRFPFRGLPVTRASHVTNVCEMYFSKFYQFEEMFEDYLAALRAFVPGIRIGSVVRQFRKIFKQELRSRHHIHHKDRFSDVSIGRVFLNEKVIGSKRRQVQQYQYRQLVKFWVREVRRSVGQFELILETVAEVTLDRCPFLSKFDEGRG